MRFSRRHFFSVKYTERVSTSAANSSASPRDVACSPDLDGVSQSPADTATKASACGHVFHSRNVRNRIEAIALPVVVAAHILAFFVPARWAAPLWLASLVVAVGAVASIAYRLIRYRC